MSKNRLPVSLQLWSIREQVAADFSGTMAEVARMGYEGVELIALGSLSAADADKALRAAGLKVSGMHVLLDPLRASVPQVVEQALTLGCKNVICPWFPPALLQTSSAFVALGEELNVIGAKLRAFGIGFHYHHHDFEIRTVDGRRGIDWILDACEPRNVSCETDVYWLQKGGLDPVRFLIDQGKRVKLVHLKDEFELGTGPVNFDAVFQTLDTIGAAEWLIVEQEQYNFPPLEAVSRCLDQMRRWGRA